MPQILHKGRDREYAEARRLREIGHGYVYIGKQIGISWGTVKNWVKDMPADRVKAQALHNQTRRKDEVTSKAALRPRLIAKRGHQCQGCSRRTWQQNPIALEMHRLIPERGYVEDNIALLCPNCHSLTDTWKGRNKRRVGVAQQADALDSNPS